MLRLLVIGGTFLWHKLHSLKLTHRLAGVM